MGRKKKGKTTTVRVRLVDVDKLRSIAKQMNLSLPDYLSLIAKGKRR